MFATPTQLTELQKSQLDAFYALSNVAFNAVQKLVDLNLAAVKAAMDESAATTQTLLGVKDAQDMVAVGGTIAQPPVQKIVGYGSNLYSIMSAAGSEARRVVEDQIAEGNTKAAQLVEFAARNAPAGSEPILSLFKNTVAAYKTAYDTFSKAAKQAFDAAESNMANATQTAVNAVTPEPEVVKGRSKKGE